MLRKAINIVELPGSPIARKDRLNTIAGRHKYLRCRSYGQRPRASSRLRLGNHRGSFFMSNVQQDVFEIISKQAKIDIGTIQTESTLKDLGIASLDAIEVIFDIEEQFNINLPNDDVDFESGTVGHLIAAVERQIAQKPAET
jgi:acyl carrier protein